MSFLDLVPVDYVAEALYSLSHNKNAAGKCYHLTAGLRNTATLEEVRDLASHYFGIEKFVLIPPVEFDRYVSEMAPKLSEEERDMLEEVKLYVPYLTCPMQFDNAQAVETTGIEAPPVNSYFGKLAQNIQEKYGG
jgi:hypothetical protein